MDDEKVPSMVHVGAMQSVCPETMEGWLWCCDDHDSHGNADSEEEARFVANAHSAFFDDPDGCDVVVWFRQPHERG
jgi:hypothetical protein